MAGLLERYLNQLLDNAEVKSYCRQFLTSKPGICRFINPSRTDPHERVSEWVYNPTGAWDEVKNKQGIYSLTRGACIDINNWLTTLSPQEAANSKNLYAGCQYDQYRNNRKLTDNTGNCQPKKEANNWADYSQSRTLSLWQSHQKSLQVCMDIMRIILLELGLTVSGARVKIDEGEGSNRCGKIYTSLEKWGGTWVARSIMKQWFAVDDKHQKLQQSFALSGTDLYEVMTEQVSGVHKGDKETECLLEGTSQPGGPLSTVVYKTKIREDIKGTEDTRHSFQVIWESMTKKAEQEQEQVNEIHDSDNQGGGIIWGIIPSLILAGASGYGIYRIIKTKKSPKVRATMKGSTRELPLTANSTVRKDLSYVKSSI
ncbi:hypothetical protein C922_05421 [Plasmodium inui San Antonio 1]|uniref:Uncharacterized protein n=1 Tax=Plasmodium inui San Antonio 1 TaxID=1237626 RepID=W6ZTF6_9APIC|nr:hypothetical protein C922_05421 [Plasmodium inui San Antonio 1]EUD64197.1 hypothetical protein C922_05421 [Plasmodium inui San Antonio 1]